MAPATPESAVNPAVLAACVVAGWLAVGALLSALSRWPARARRYPGGRRPAGLRLRGQVYAIGIVHENNVTGLVATAAGLYLYSNPLFRFRRPPVLLPWPAVRHVRTHRLLWWRWHTLDLAGITTMRVSERARQAIAPHASPDLGALLPNEALQLSGMQGHAPPALGTLSPRHRRSPKTRS